MERPDLTVAATVAARTKRLRELDGIVADWCAERSTGWLADALQGVGIPSSAVVDAIDLRGDPHVVERGTLADLVHPASPGRPSGYLGTTMPIRMSGYTVPPPTGSDPGGKHPHRAHRAPRPRRRRTRGPGLTRGDRVGLTPLQRDVDVFGAEELVEAGTSTLLADTAQLVPAERGRRRQRGESVDRDVAGVELGRHPVGARWRSFVWT